MDVRAVVCAVCDCEAFNVAFRTSDGRLCLRCKGCGTITLTQVVLHEPITGVPVESEAIQ
jgi:hypothetical protein